SPKECFCSPVDQVDPKAQSPKSIHSEQLPLMRPAIRLIPQKWVRVKRWSSDELKRESAAIRSDLTSVNRMRTPVFGFRARLSPSSNGFLTAHCSLSENHGGDYATSTPSVLGDFSENIRTDRRLPGHIRY
ncbi:MAG TPA: hypothetical protein PLY87_12860, partial [Planctomycetaceae bacterium]|nr:hypothetical protein [Planctomycetaceae bacterium]